MNAALTGVQQRNLEAMWGLPVLDRVGLIIEIFGQRARTKEARLQVLRLGLVIGKEFIVAPASPPLLAFWRKLPG